MVIALLYYSDVFFAGYLSDDYSFLNDISSFGDVFSKLTLGFFRPAVRLSFWLEFAVFGRNPVASHSVNLILHVAVLVLSYYTIRMLFDDEALAFGSVLIFSLHFVQVEVVTWVSARSNSIMMLLGLSFIILFLKKSRFLSLLLFLMVLISKESGFIFIFILAVILLSGKNSIRSAFKKLFPCLITALAYMLFYLYITQDKQIRYLSDAGKILPSFFSYLNLYIFPEKAFPLFYMAMALMLLILVIRKEADLRLMAVSLSFFLLPVLLLSYSNQLFFRYRYLYVSCLGFSMLSYYLLRKLFFLQYFSNAGSKGRILKIILIITVFAFAGLNIYNSFLIKRDFNKYSRLYRDLGRKTARDISRDPPEFIVISGFPHVLGKTRLFFLMAEDAVKYYSGHDIRVIQQKESMAEKIIGLYYEGLITGPQAYVLCYSRKSGSIEEDERLKKNIEEFLGFLFSEEDLILAFNLMSEKTYQAGYRYISAADFSTGLLPPAVRTENKNIRLYAISNDMKQIEIENRDGVFYLYELPGYLLNRYRRLKVISDSESIKIYYNSNDLPAAGIKKDSASLKAKAFKR